MRISRPTKIIGGVALGSLSMLLLVQLVLASHPPIPPNEFLGNVNIGAIPAPDGTEVKVKVKDLTVDPVEFVDIALTEASVDASGDHLTSGDRYGDFQVFQVPVDDPDTPERDGAGIGESLFFFAVVEGVDVQAQMTDEDGAEIPFEDGIPFKPGFTFLNLAVDVPAAVQNLRKFTPDTDNTPQFRWKRPASLPAAGLKDYQVTITGDADLTQPFNIGPTSFVDTDFFNTRCFDASGDLIGSDEDCLTNIATTNKIRMTLLVEVPDGTHLLGVTAVDQNDELGPTAEISFTIRTEVGPPILLEPSDGSLINDPTPLFDWDKGTGEPDSYLLLVTSDDTSSLVLTADVPAPTTSFQVTDGLTDGPYSWTVVAQAEGAEPAAATPFSFNLDSTGPAAAELREPPDQSETAESAPTFVWTQVTLDTGGGPESFGVTYTLEIDTVAGDFSGPDKLTFPNIPDNAVNSGSESVIEFPLADEGVSLDPNDYVWRVRANDQAGNEGELSVEFTFTKRPAVDLRLEASPQVIRAGTVFTVTIKVEPQAGEAVSAVDAFLNFDPSDVEAISIADGSTLEEVLIGDFDNGQGHVNYGAVTFGAAPTTPFVLAVVTFRARVPGASVARVDSAISFSNAFPRLSRADYKGESVLGTTFDVTTAILNPLADLLLGIQQEGDDEPRFFSGADDPNFDGFSIARDEVFDVVVAVNGDGQDITTVDALLDFDSSALEALAVEATGDDRVETVLATSFDNEQGTVDFSALVTGDPDERYNLAVVTFRARRASEALSVGFHQEFPRKTEVALAVKVNPIGVASVLDELIGFPAEIALQLRLTSFDPPNAADVLVQVRPNGNRVSAVDALLDFDPADIQVTGVTPGALLVEVLTGDFDNSAGTIDIGALTLGPPTIGEFVLATISLTLPNAAITSDLEDRELLFSESFPRETKAAFDGAEVPTKLAPLATLTPFPPGQLPNLEKSTPDNQTGAEFDWDPPIARPVAGLETFIVSIEGSGTGAGPTSINGDSTDVGTLECFSVDELGVPRSIPCTLASPINIDEISFFRLSLTDTLADGRYTLSVTPFDNLGQSGEPTELPDFVIDTAAPPTPAATAPLPREGEVVAFVNDTTPELAWTESEDPLSDVEYDLHLSLSEDGLQVPGARQEFNGLSEITRVVENLDLDTVYWWHVRAVDQSGVAPAAALEPGSDGPSPLAPIVGRGNASDFSIPSRFVIDTVSPSDPQNVENISAGNDPTPTIRWARSSDPGYIGLGLEQTGSGVDLYNVDITLSGDGVTVTGSVADSDCNPISGLCQFTVVGPELSVDGTYQVEVTAVDVATNESTPATTDFLLDTTAPSAPVNVRLFDQSGGDTGTDAVFRWRRSTDAGSGVDTYQVEISPGSITATVDHADCTLGGNNNQCELTAEELSDGGYEIGVVAVDVATNESAESTADIFVGDDTRPLNLRQRGDSLFDSNPIFEWIGPQTPVAPPLTDYELGSADFGDPIGDFVSFTDTGLFECLDDQGQVIPCVVPADLTETISLRFKVDLADGNYRVGVRTVGQGGSVSSAAQVPFDVDETPPEAPSNLELDNAEPLNSPFLEDDSRIPEFSWTASSGDTGDGVVPSGFDRYELIISGDELTGDGTPLVTFTRTVGTETGDISFTLAVEDSLPDDLYQAALVAVDVAGNRSDPAIADFFIDLDAPGPPFNLRRTAPIDTTDASPSFEWDPAVDDGLGVDKYRVHLESENLTDTTLPQAPELLSPANQGAVRNEDATLSWKQVQDDTNVIYQLEVATGGQPAGSFDSNIVFIGDIPDDAVDGVIEVNIGNLAIGTGYVWQVRTVDQGRNVSSFSPRRIFDVVEDNTPPAAPILSLPADGADFENPTPAFVWSVVEDLPNTGEPVTYTMRIARGTTAPDLDNPLLVITGIEDENAGTPDDVEFTLADEDALRFGQYIWDVAAVDVVGLIGNPSAPLTFTVNDTTAPDVPDPVFPGVVDTGDLTTGGDTTPSFQWEPVGDPAGVVYTLRLEVATGDTGDQFENVFPDTGDIPNDIVVRNGIEVVEFILPDGLALDDGLYRWRVQSEDLIENVSAFSGPLYFVIGEDNEAPGAPVLTDPADGSETDDPTPEFQWSGVSDPSGVNYVLQVSPDEDFSRLDVNEAGLTTNSFTPSVALTQDQVGPQEIFWRVKAEDGSETPGSNSSAFTTGIFSLDFIPTAAPKLASDLPDPTLSGATYSTTVRWPLDPDVEHYEVSLNNGIFTGAGTSDSFDTGEIDFGRQHVARVKAFDIIGNESLGALFFNDDETAGDVTTFGVADRDFLALGDHTIEVRSQDPLNRQQIEPADLVCRVGDEVICELSISFDPRTPTLSSAGGNQSLQVVIDPLGLEVDGAIISIDLATGLTLVSVETSDGVALSDLETGDGTIVDFTATLDEETTGDITLATLNISVPSGAATYSVDFVNAADRKTVGRFRGEDVAALLLDATITVSAPSGGGGGGGPANTAPTANAGSDRTADEGDSVTLSGSADDTETDPGALIVSWSQTSGPPVATFVDTNTLTPTFRAADNGTHVFTLTVTDLGPGPLTNSNTVTVEVDNVAPVVDAGANQTIRLSEDVTLGSTFDDAGSADTHIATIDWGDDSDDDTIDPANSPLSASHTYAEGGDFTVTVTVDDDDGDSDSDTLTVTVQVVNLPPIADAGADQSAAEGDTLLFDGSGSTDDGGEIVQYLWDFGDNQTAEGVTVTHEYGDSGDFTVTLTVVDDEGAASEPDTAIATITNVVPTVDAGDDQTVDEGDTVSITPTFQDAGSDDTHIAVINWGDQSDVTVIDSAVSPIAADHAYGDQGTFTVTVTVTDDNGGIGTSSLTVTALNVTPEVRAGTDIGGLVGEDVTFAGAFVDPGFDDTHTIIWTLGDGTIIADDLTPTHTYASAGEFTATLTVTDDDGGPERDSIEVVIVDVAPIDAALEASNLTLSKDDPSAGEPVTALFQVTNISGAEFDGTVDLFVRGAVEETFQVELAAGGSKTLGTQIVRTEDGAYPVQVGTELAIFNIAPPEIVVFNLTVIPRKAAENNVVEIAAEVLNAGGSAATFPVNVRVDNSDAPGQLTLPAGASAPIIRLVQIPSPIPASGIASFDKHTVRVDGEKDFYRVVEPALVSNVPTRYRFSPDSTSVVDAEGNTVQLVVDDELVIGEGSISLAIPVRASLGTRIASFVDTNSGISIIGKNVRLPIRNPITGEVLLRLEGELNEELEGAEDGNSAQGTFKSLSLMTEESVEDLSEDDPIVGKMAVSFTAGLDRLPDDVSLEITIKKELSDEDKTAVELQAREQESKIIANEAGTVSVQTTGLTTDDTSEIELTMKVDFQWAVEFGLQNIRIAHVDEFGNVELLNTECNVDLETFQVVCKGVTDKGFSDFSLLAIKTQPAEFSAGNLVVNPEAVEPGDPVTISIDVLNEGRTLERFSTILRLKGPGDAEALPVSVKEITLGAGETGQLRFFFLTPEDVNGRYEVEIEGRRGEVLTGFFDVFTKIDVNLLRFESLAIRPAAVRPGELVIISMFVSNDSDSDGSTEIELFINGELFAVKSQFVPARGSVEVFFEFIPPAEGVYSIGLPSLSGEVIARIPLTAFSAVFANLAISPPEVLPGELVTVTFQLGNAGETAGDAAVALLIDGVEVDSTTVSLDGLETVPGVTFTFTAPDEPGLHTIDVEGLTGSFTVLSVIDIPLRILDVIGIPGTVERGQLIFINVDVENPADAEATRTLSLTLDGQVVDTQTVTLGPGETTTVTFSFRPPDEPGLHRFDVEGTTREFTVVTAIVPALMNLIPPLTISPSQAEPGQLVTISARILNSGQEAGSATVVLLIDDLEVERRSVQIPGQSDRTVTFTITAEQAERAYNVRVEVGEADQVKVVEGSFTVAEPEPQVPQVANIIAVPGSLSLDADSVDSGHPITLTVSFTNDGGIDGTRTFKLLIDDEEIETREVAVAAGETTVVDFTFVERGSGTHTASVAGLSTEFSITKPAPMGLTIALILIFGFVMAGLAVLLYVRARRVMPPAASV